MHVASVPAEVEITLLRPGARPPARAHPEDAGYDLFSVEHFELAPGERRVVPTGVAIALPSGVAGLVIPRSGLAVKHGLSVVNAPGLIDPNYRGEVCLVLINLGADIFGANAGDRLAQLLLVPYWTPDIRVVETLRPSGDDRGVRGLGSSGR